MKTLLVFLGFVIGVLAQNPAANIAINQTNVTGGISGDCLTVSSTKKLGQQVCGGGGTITSIATSNGIAGGGISGAVTISGINAAADGATKGVAAFTAADFNATAGLLSLDYVNGQKATAIVPGFLSSADWTTFNNKQSATAPGSDTQVIFHDGTGFGADAGFTYNKTTDSLTIAGKFTWAATGNAGGTFEDFSWLTVPSQFFGISLGPTSADTNPYFEFDPGSQQIVAQTDSMTDAYTANLRLQATNGDAMTHVAPMFGIFAVGAYTDAGVKTGTFSLTDEILSINFLSYASGGAFTLNTTRNYGLLTNFGSAGGFFEAKDGTEAGCTSGAFCASRINLRATVDPSSKYLDSNITFYGYNPNAMTPIFPGLTEGVECNYANNDAKTNCRYFMVDKVSGDNIGVYDFVSKVFTWYPQTSIDDDFAVTGTATLTHVNSTTNCADSAGAAACAAAPAGSVVIDAGASTVVVSTTAVGASSQIFVMFDSSLSTKLSVTCNATVALPVVTARTTSTSFTITVPAAPAVNPACFNYWIIN